MARCAWGPGGGPRRHLGSGLLTLTTAAIALCWAGADLLGFVAPAAWRPALHPAAARPGRTVPRRAWDLFGQIFGQEESGVEDAPRVQETPSTPLPAGPDSPEGFDSVDRELPILHYPHPALRRTNERVEEFDGRLRKLADNLFRTMYSRGDGIGLAAPQVGVNLRVMVYNPNPSSRDDETVFVNPRIVEISGESEAESESCLSFPRMRGPVKRPVWVRVQAVDWDGCPFERRLNGFEARLFQHEYDHLDGVVYIDRLPDSWLSAVQPELSFLIEDYKRNGAEDPAL